MPSYRMDNSMKKTLLSTAFVFAAPLVNAAEPDAGMVDFVNATARAWFQLGISALTLSAEAGRA